MRNRYADRLLGPLALVLLSAQCSGASSPGRPSGTGGDEPPVATGGRVATGGSTAGGSAATGGSPANGGNSTGGAASGGASTTGGAATGGRGGAATGGASGMPDAGPGPAPGDASTPPPPPPSSETPLPPCKRMVPVAGGGALGGAVSGAMPGDCLVLADGQYAALTISAQGTAEAPIVIRAANRLQASFTGTVKLTNAAHVVLEGFTFPGGAGTSIDGTSHHNRITRSRYFTGTANVNGTADNNRIDHCEFGPKNNDGNLVQPTGMSTNTRIDHNYFHDVSPGGGNGRETIRLGCCGATFDYHETGNIVEHNLLVNCSGEAEIISIKASKNTVRYNTIRGSAGNLTLRAGRNNTIYGNFIFGDGKQGGIRMFEDGHRIFNNYIETGAALIANRSGPIHAPVRNAIIVHNTFLGSVAITGSGNTFADNITGGSVSLGGTTGQGNLTADAAGLMRVDGVMAIMPMSKAIDAATGTYPFLMDDVNGQPRAGKADVGADELSAMPALFRPLTPKDVGPDAP